MPPTTDTETAPGTPAAAEQIYTPAPGERQLTARALVVACAIGTLIATINVYFGLKAGWTFGGSILAAILAYAAFAVLRPRTPFTVLETNIAQTAASAAGTMVTAGGLVAPIPALLLLDREAGLPPWHDLMLWSAAVGFLGVFFAVPLRRQMVVVERLRFPGATATAHTIVAMFGSGAETLRRARTLLRWALVAGAFVLLCWFVRPVKDPPLHVWMPAAFGWLALHTVRLSLDPLLMGAGILVGMRVSLSLVGGALVAWLVLAPWVTAQGWAVGPLTDPKAGARAWILWPGVAIMMGEALMGLALSWRTIVAVFRPSRSGADGAGGPDEGAGREGIPAFWWLGGLAAGTALAAGTLDAVFGVPVWQTLVAVALSSVLAAIAVRSVGETDINPVSGVAKVTQLVFGPLAPGQVATNLLAGGVTGAGASQAADMLGDLKTGHLLGASPRKQFLAQLVGVAAGVLVCVPIFLLVTDGGRKIGSDDLPGVSAQAWKATAEVLARGLTAVPESARWGALVGLLFGASVPLLRRFVPRTARYLPSAMAVGIAFILQAFQVLPFLIGALIHHVWRRRAPQQAADLGFAVASGILVGAGLTNVLTSVLEALQVQPWVTLPRPR